MITIPPEAITVWFEEGEKQGTYHIWKKEVKVCGGTETVWCWVALGNSGRAGTAQEATAAAKQWIRDASGLKIDIG